MIKNITMRNCATYGAEGAELSGLTKVNFIYGANGSGKSTVAGYIENTANPVYSECSIEWENSSVQTLVYNKKFRHDNLKEYMDGIFTLGSDSQKLVDEIETLKKLRKEEEDRARTHEKAYKDKCTEQEQFTNEYQDKVWNIVFQKYDNTFAEAFTGLRNSKNKFFKELRNRIATYSEFDGSYEDLIQRAKVLFGEIPEPCEMFISSFDKFDLLTASLSKIEEDAVWQTVIAGSSDVPLAGLISELGNSDWVAQGRNYVTNDKRCPFCQQETIDDNFKKQLETFFNREYTEKLEYIASLKSAYTQKSETLLTVFRELLDEKTKIEIGNLNVEACAQKLEILKQLFEANTRIFDDKTKEPGRKFTMSDTSDCIAEILDLLKKSDENILKHNELVKDFNNQRQKLKVDVWNYCITEQKEFLDEEEKQLKTNENAVNGTLKSLEKHKLKAEELANEIREKEKNVTGVQYTVDKINRLLETYGFQGFKIEPCKTVKNCYQLVRTDGTCATTTLSEGEETFITFLYFMQLAEGAKDAKKVSDKRIIVLDDPVCSLDSTVLYIVSSMITALACDVLGNQTDVIQLFVLTHNIYFHKEISALHEHKKSSSTGLTFWTISKRNNVSAIQNCGHTNPVKSSYTMLWQELRENSDISSVCIQNIMRRILENYFEMVGGLKNLPNIVEKCSTAEETMACKALTSCLNDGSHSIPDDFNICTDLDTVEPYKAVFRKIFENLGHLEHYNMMMGIETE